MGTARTRPPGRSRSARRPAERTGDGADRRQGRADRQALATRVLPAIEATAFVSPKWVPQMADAAAVMARIRRKDGRPLSGADAEPQGLRGCARGERRRGRRVRRRVGDVLAEEHQLHDRREPRARAACLRRGGREWRARARLHLVRARMPVRRRGRAGRRSRRSRRRSTGWAPTKFRSATRSASGRPAGRRRWSRP